MCQGAHFLTLGIQQTYLHIHSKDWSRPIENTNSPLDNVATPVQIPLSASEQLPCLLTPHAQRSGQLQLCWTSIRLETQHCSWIADRQTRERVQQRPEIAQDDLRQEGQGVRRETGIAIQLVQYDRLRLWL